MSLLAAIALQVVTAPYPDTLSQAARDGLAENEARAAPATDLASRRARADSIQQEIGRRQLARYGVTVADATIAGVPVRVFTPRGGAKAGAVLFNLHGGGFVVDSGSMSENVPIAALTGRRVVAVRYRLSPEHRFPAALEDALVVYRALVKQTRRVALYGTSAGAILSAELVARLKVERQPLPVALGFFSGSANLSELGDTATLFLGPPAASRAVAALYAGTLPLDDLALSPGRGDLSGWPPTLCISSTRDFLLSGTAELCRRLEAAGSDARLLVYDGLPHAFWSYIEAPESDAAFAAMARFLTRRLGHRP